MLNHIVMVWERNFQYHHRWKALKNSKQKFSGKAKPISESEYGSYMAHMKSIIPRISHLSDTAGPVWLGTTDEEIEGTWKNIYTGEIVHLHPQTPKLIPFGNGEPNNSKGNEVSELHFNV